MAAPGSHAVSSIAAECNPRGRALGIMSGKRPRPAEDDASSDSDELIILDDSLARPEGLPSLSDLTTPSPAAVSRRSKVRLLARSLAMDLSDSDSPHSHGSTKLSRGNHCVQMVSQSRVPVVQMQPASCSPLSSSGRNAPAALTALRSSSEVPRATRLSSAPRSSSEVPRATRLSSAPRSSSEVPRPTSALSSLSSVSPFEVLGPEHSQAWTECVCEAAVRAISRNADTLCAPAIPHTLDALPRAVREDPSLLRAVAAASASSMSAANMARVTAICSSTPSLVSVVAVVATNEPVKTVHALERARVPVVKLPLPIGDVAWCVSVRDGVVDRLFVTGFVWERKTVNDLLMSLRSTYGRHTLQQWFLHRCGLRRVTYVVEGDTECKVNYAGSQDTNAKAVATSIRSMMASGSSVVRTKSVSETAQHAAATWRHLCSKVASGWRDWLHPHATFDSWSDSIKAMKLSEKTVGNLTSGSLLQIPNVRADAMSHCVRAAPTVRDMWRHASRPGGLRAVLEDYAREHRTHGVTTSLPLGVSERMLELLTTVLTAM
jgi:ERCC4-type nuclease